MEGVVCKVGEMSEEGATWDAHEVEVICQERTKRKRCVCSHVGDRETCGGRRGRDESQRPVGDGCPSHDIDELGDIGREVFGIDRNDITGHIWMVPVEIESKVTDVLPMLLGRQSSISDDGCGEAAGDFEKVFWWDLRYRPVCNG
jgi:hypothetical protein